MGMKKKQEEVFQEIKRILSVERSQKKVSWQNMSARLTWQDPHQYY
jgi:hypothetical protein